MIDGHTYARIVEHPNAALVAPLAFGDSFLGAPVVGSTPDFVLHLSGALADGRLFANQTEAIVGARVSLGVGEKFSPFMGVAMMRKTRMVILHMKSWAGCR